MNGLSMKYVHTRSNFPERSDGGIFQRWLAGLTMVKPKHKIQNWPGSRGQTRESGKTFCRVRSSNTALPSLCLAAREMRRKYLTTRPKNLSTLDLLADDEILYRDENYFAELNSSARPNPSVIGVPQLSTFKETSDPDSTSSPSSSESIESNIFFVGDFIIVRPNHGSPSTWGDWRPGTSRALQGRKEDGEIRV